MSTDLPTARDLARLFVLAMTADGPEGEALRGALCDEHGSLLSTAMKYALLSRGAEGYSEAAEFATRFVLTDPNSTTYTLPIPAAAGGRRRR